MKNTATLFAAFVSFVIALMIFWVGRADIAKSMWLMGVVCFWFLMAFLFALHADTAGNLQIIVRYVPILGGLINGQRSTDPQMVSRVDDSPKAEP